MSDLLTLTVDGKTYTIKDQEARAAIAEASAAIAKAVKMTTEAGGDPPGTIRLDGTNNLEANIAFENNRGLLMKDTDGNEYDVLRLSSLNNFSLGYGPYAANMGETRIFGDTTRLYSNNPIITNNDIKVKGHDEPIGYTENATSVSGSVASNTNYHDTGYSTTLSPGVYLLITQIEVNTSSAVASSRMGLRWYVAGSGQDLSTVTIPMTTGNLRIQSIAVVTILSSATAKSQIFQNSGATQTYTSLNKVVRLV